MERFNSSGGLSGWFDGFCPSKGIAEDTERKTRNVLAEKKSWDAAYNHIKNGAQAAEWADLKIEIADSEKIIKLEKQKLQQEKEIASSLGLGAFCNGAVSRRKKAETSLRSAENSLGQIKGAYNTLQRQQTDGIRRASEVIITNKKTIEDLKKQIVVVKQKIATYKAERDKIKLENEAALKSANAPVKTKVTNFFSKENLPLIGGIIFGTGVIIYLRTKKKKNNKGKVKKVEL